MTRRIDAQRPATRRSFIQAGAALAAVPLFGNRVARTEPREVAFAENPFQLGVASGEPASDGFVIWTRLASEPAEEGGLPAANVEIAWQLATDEDMRHVVRRGVAVATPQLAHSVHVELHGLQPDRWYWYQFQAGSELSPIGRARTVPANHVLPKKLRFAFASCQHFEQGYFTAFEHMASEDLDLVVHLGDYIYENGGRENEVRKHSGGEIMTLADYRNRYAQYRTDPHLQTVHARFPWIVTWDDHELDNNYADDISEESDVAAADFLVRRANAYQAFYEHMPLRRSSLPAGPDMQLFRRLRYGRLVDFAVLDTRQYRTDQPNGDGLRPREGDVFDPRATILGRRQEQWLKRTWLQSRAEWNVLAQQVMLARVDRIPGEEDRYSMDQWSGYEACRDRVLSFLHQRQVPNPVVLTGDVHTNYVNDLLLDVDDPQSPVLGSEFVGTSISSGGDGPQKLDYTDGMLAENPWVKFHNAERGYVSCTVTPDHWRSDYQVVEYVTRPGAPLITRQSFVIENGEPGVKPA
jgi:alkaline phosphatase D